MITDRNGNITVTVARKPVVGTVAANALKWGTGGLNIDQSRIGCGPNGRWPANVIIIHKSGCQFLGTEKDQYVINVWTDGAKPFGGGAGHEFESEDQALTIEKWNCEPGCPCRVLDEQTGDHPVSGAAKKGTESNYAQTGIPGNSMFGSVGGDPAKMPNDVGGVSRYFKQVQSDEDLVSYLTNMVGAPGRPGAFWPRLDQYLAVTPKNCLPGLVAVGEPSAEQAASLLRVLAPGAFLFLIAPVTRPSGHVGACNLEDVGFEIRDTLLLVCEGGKFHYVPKANRVEREAGCNNLPAITGAEAVKRIEGTDGLKSPRAGAGRTADTIHNGHPTVKAIGIMECLLQDIPAGTVLDPFLGSGSTGIACLLSGHDFAGIEREEDYLKIADARIRYWAHENRNWRVEIQSDIAPAVKAPVVWSLEDWLGLSS